MKGIPRRRNWTLAIVASFLFLWVGSYFWLRLDPSLEIRGGIPTLKLDPLLISNFPIAFVTLPEGSPEWLLLAYDPLTLLDQKLTGKFILISIREPHAPPPSAAPHRSTTSVLARHNAVRPTRCEATSIAWCT